MRFASLLARNVRIGEQVRSFGNEFPIKRLALARFPLGVCSRRVWFFCAIQVVAVAAEASLIEPQHSGRCFEIRVHLITSKVVIR